MKTKDGRIWVCQNEAPLSEQWKRWLAERITVTYECDLHCKDIIRFVET
jgi:hypothetical protein